MKDNIKSIRNDLLLWSSNSHLRRRRQVCGWLRYVPMASECQCPVFPAVLLAMLPRLRAGLSNIRVVEDVPFHWALMGCAFSCIRSLRLVVGPLTMSGTWLSRPLPLSVELVQIMKLPTPSVFRCSLLCVCMCIRQWMLCASLDVFTT